MVRVQMVLAAGPGLPEGNTEDRLDVEVMLTPLGRLDEAAWHEDAPWPATRTRPGRQLRHSEIVRADEQWAMRSTRGEDEPLWAMEAEVVRPGELVRFRRPDGEALFYRIVAMG